MHLPKFINHKSSIINRSEGFTLIELLIVITIIAILVASGIYSWQAAQVKGRDNRRKTDLKAVQQALETYYNVNSLYPASNGSSLGPGVITCNVGGVITTGNSWGGAFTCGNTYLSKLPTDPTQQSTAPYYYSSSAPYTTYTLSAAFENTKDPDITNSCSPLPCYNYVVKNP